MKYSFIYKNNYNNVKLQKRYKTIEELEAGLKWIAEMDYTLVKVIGLDR